MRVNVDYDLCQGHAMCELESPDVFTVPKRGVVDVLIEEPPEDLHADVRNAARACPSQAIQLIEDE